MKKAKKHRYLKQKWSKTVKKAKKHRYLKQKLAKNNQKRKKAQVFKAKIIKNNEKAKKHNFSKQNWPAGLLACRLACLAMELVAELARTPRASIVRPTPQKAKKHRYLKQKLSKTMKKAKKHRYLKQKWSKTMKKAKKHTYLKQKWSKTMKKAKTLRYLKQKWSFLFFIKKDQNLASRGAAAKWWFTITKNTMNNKFWSRCLQSLKSGLLKGFFKIALSQTPLVLGACLFKNDMFSHMKMKIPLKM